MGSSSLFSIITFPTSGVYAQFLQFKETLMSNSAVVESVAQALRYAELNQAAIAPIPSTTWW